MFKSIIAIAVVLAASALHAQCAMTSPEQTLRCYEAYTRDKNLEGLMSIYWQLTSFTFAESACTDVTYDIVDVNVYINDLDVGGGDVPIWARAGNVEIISKKGGHNRAQTFSHVFRKIHGKWYMVGHSALGVDVF